MPGNPESVQCSCGWRWDFPDYVLEHSHLQYTLICDCARAYIVLLGCVTLKTKPVWPWKRPQR